MVLRSPDISEFNELKVEVKKLGIELTKLKEQLETHEKSDRAHKRYPM